MEDNKSMFYIVSIIAIVAIVGLVVLIVHASTGQRAMYANSPRAYTTVADTTATESEDAAGQAFRANAIPKGATVYNPGNPEREVMQANNNAGATIGTGNDKKPDSSLCMCKGGTTSFFCSPDCAACCGAKDVKEEYKIVNN